MEIHDEEIPRGFGAQVWLAANRNSRPNSRDHHPLDNHLKKSRLIFRQLPVSRPLILLNCLLLALSLIFVPVLSRTQALPVALLFTIESGSMEPNLHLYDIIVVDKSFPFNSLKIGDIIVFRTNGTTDHGQHEIMAHRVAQIVNDNQGLRVIRTKGDTNNDSIPFLDYPIREQNYIGKAVYTLALNESARQVVGLLSK